MKEFTTGSAHLPTYADLLARTDAPPGSAWHVFSHGDQLGTLNLLDAERARAAASLVRRGACFNLDYSLSAFSPPLSPNRRAARHTIFKNHDGRVVDDRLDDFYLQISSQFDGLRHHRHSVHGFYGGVADDAVAAGSEALGIQLAAERTIVGRGVLLDVARYLADRDAPLVLSAAIPIETKVLDEVAAAQGVRFEPGDILLLNTGWARYAVEECTAQQRADLATRFRFCGLTQSRDTLAWIWDHHFSVVASDTFAVEVMPPVDSSPFTDNVMRMMHPDIIALLGVHLGELWKLDELAADCAADGVYEFMVTAKPLNLVGGVGSPPNAIAIK